MNQQRDNTLCAPTGSVAEGMRPIVPDLVGLGLAAASEAVAWAGTSVNATSVTRSRGPWGVVVAQTPASGTTLRAMWQVHVLVAVPPFARAEPLS